MRKSEGSDGMGKRGKTGMGKEKGQGGEGKGGQVGNLAPRSFLKVGAYTSQICGPLIVKTSLPKAILPRM